MWISLAMSIPNRLHHCPFFVFFVFFWFEDVSYNCKLQLQPHQGTLCCIVSVGLLLFLNRKTEKPSPRWRWMVSESVFAMETPIAYAFPRPSPRSLVSASQQPPGTSKYTAMRGTTDPTPHWWVACARVAGKSVSTQAGAVVQVLPVRCRRSSLALLSTLMRMEVGVCTGAIPLYLRRGRVKVAAPKVKTLHHQDRPSGRTPRTCSDQP
jgi:hypothetical protein